MVYQDQLRIGRLQCVNTGPNHLEAFLIPFPPEPALIEKFLLPKMVHVLHDLSDGPDLGDTYMDH
jgi:hypothetical protein